jgi:MSHA biogenesis protein MshQ
MPVLKRCALVILSILVLNAPAQGAITLRGTPTQNSITVYNPITYIGASAVAATYDSTTCPGNISPAVPAGAIGDLLLAFAVVRADAAAVSASAGWNALYSGSFPGGVNFKVYIYYRIATTASGAADNITITEATTCNSMAGRVARFRGVDTASPFLNVPIPGGNAVIHSTNDIDTGTETTVNTDAMLLVASFINDDDIICEGGGWNASFESIHNFTNRDLTLNLHYQLQTTAGAKSISNWSIDDTSATCASPNADPNFGIIFSLRPATPGLTINVPAGTTTGDFMVAAIAAQPSSITTLQPPAGWTSLIRTDNGAGNTSAQQIFYRVANGAEPANYTWTFSQASTGAAGGIISYIDVDTDNPFAATTVGNAVSGTSHTVNQTTTSADNAMLVAAYSFASSMTYTSTSGMTGRVNESSLAVPDANGISLGMFDAVQAVAGLTGNKTATVTGNGDNGVAHLLALRPLAPVLHFNMDEAAWSGAADEVLDDSGNNLHGTSFSGANTFITTPAIAGDPGTCRYGDFAGGVSNQYVRANDTALLDVSSELTAMAWINPDTIPGSGLMTIISKDENFEFHVTAAGQINWWWNNSGGATHEIFTTGAPTITAGGGWYHIAIVHSQSAGAQTVYINGVARGSSSYAEALINNSDPFMVGNDQGFAGRFFDGQIDEVYVFRSALTQTKVVEYMNKTHPCGLGPDHYAISYPLGQPGITCEAQAVRITAHADATDHSLLMAPSNTTQITVSTTPAAGGWTLKSGGGTFVTGPGAGQAQYTFDGSEQFAEFWLTQTTATTAPHIDIDVTDGTATDVDPGAEDARAQFADTAFRFFADAVAEGIGTQIAGKSSSVAPGNQALQLRAVQTSTTTGACQAALGGVTDVELAFSCNNPTTCKTANGVTIAANSTVAVQDNPNGGPYTYSTVSMNFGGTGVAPFSLNYADAGQITLHARKVLTASGATTPPTTADTLTGDSNAFVVKPAGVCVESTDPDSDCVSGDATCSVFKKAGTSGDADPGSKFNLTVRGVTWEGAGDTNYCSGVAGTNLTTPNFQLNAIPLTHAKVRPTGAGSQTGSLGVTSVNIAPADDGAATIANQAISEVGVFTITATPPLYLGETIAASTSANIGRFIPDRFTVTDNNPGFVNACTTGGTPFTYRGQEFYYGTAPALTVTAVNTAGAATVNYGDSTGGPERFWKLSSTLSRSYSDQSGHVAAFASSALASATLSGDVDFADGAGVLTLGNTLGNRDIFIYDRPDPSILEAPFAASVNLTFLTAGLTDSDGVCYDRDNNGTCDAYTHLSQGGAEAGSLPIGGTSQRFGRLMIGTAGGSELLPLSLPVRTEYHNGTSFVTNTDDVCTVIAASDLRLTSGVEGPETDGNIDVSNGAGCAVGVSTVTVANTPFVNGQAGVSFSAPGESCTGYAEVTIDLSAVSLTIGAETYPDMEFLRFDWLDADGNEDGPYTADPNGRADFGIHEGPRSLIYTRDPR